MRTRSKGMIFISYARSDQEEVSQIYQRLANEGFSPWLDVYDILGGDDWTRAIQQAIRKSDFFLVCLSKNSIGRKGMLLKELKMALDMRDQMLSSDIYLIPVRLEECEIPEALMDLQHIDLFRKDGWTRLLDAINIGRKRRTEVIKPKIVETGRKNKQAMVKRMRGLIAMQSNDLDSAEKNLQDALNIWQDLGFDKYIAIALGELGQLAQKQKKFDAAERFYRQSVALARKIDDKEVQTMGLSYESQLAVSTEKWTEARERCEHALKLAKQLGYIEIIAQAQFNLAQVHEADGHTELALSSAQEALKIYERLQHSNLTGVRDLVKRLEKKM